jgi:predicted nucleic acid-binding protein
MTEKVEFQFIDTNVLVYAHDFSAGIKHEQAKALVKSVWESGAGCLSIQVLQELYVTITRKVLRPLTIEIATQIISDLGTWRVHEPRVEDVLGAAQIQFRYKISFWDAMIIQSTIQLGCFVLWSEDLNAGQEFQKVRVINPFDIASGF